jgi:hypothetical protein
LQASDSRKCAKLVRMRRDWQASQDHGHRRLQQHDMKPLPVSTGEGLLAAYGPTLRAQVSQASRDALVSGLLG